MRFLADEGVDAAIVTAIRSDGHDVRWMAEEMEGSTDDVVLAAAARDARILITEDKSWGNRGREQISKNIRGAPISGAGNPLPSPISPQQFLSGDTLADRRARGLP
jgi:hypothetical protein